jgi:hypothetical protein
MSYSRGTSSNIIVGAAALFLHNGPLSPSTLNTFTATESFKTTLSSDTDYQNVGYTMNGLELQFQPDFGEVQVDQILDVAKLYKQGMQVNLATAFAEATLENLLVALAYGNAKLTDPALSGSLAIADTDTKRATAKAKSTGLSMDLSAGDIGECPVDRGIVAVGPGTGSCADSAYVERVYSAYRALSIENVTVSAKRDEASMFEVTFRLLPEDASGSYGKIVDRTWAPA